MFKLILLLIFTIECLVSRVESKEFFQQCPSTYGCFCDISVAYTLTIGNCNQTLPSTIQLPYFSPDLTPTASIIMKNNKFVSFPSNLCQFQTYLRIIEADNNQINDSLTASTLTCLSKLEFFNASRNLIRNIDANAFNQMTSLMFVDLSYNLINTLPSDLFSPTKTPNIQVILLNNNYIIDFDIWYILFPKIIRIDLSYNSIATFTNKMGYRPNAVVAKINITNTTQINLNYNKLTKFDDTIISNYFLCTTYFDLAYFLNLLSPILMDQNQFDCSCSSYNLLKQYQYLVSQSLIKTSSNLFKATCVTPGIYLGRSIFSFISDINGDCGNSIYANQVTNCISTTTLNTVTIFNPNNPELLIASVTNKTVTYDLTDGQIGGVVIGFLGAALLILILLYCICPIEILACMFSMCPSFYTFCPCKSGVVTNKKYDLFISYNKSNQDWIRNKFLPFIKQKNPIHSYFLQYGELNVEGDDFNDIIRDAMENSGCIMLVLSDEYLMKEWQNGQFKSHLRYLLTKVPKNPADIHRLICIQMHDVCDEEVDDYVRHHLQLPRFISLETDEFYFWQKLDYYLHTNNIGDIEKVQPVNYSSFELKVNDNIDFKHYNIKAPIVHVPPKSKNAYINNNPNSADESPQNYISNEKYKNFDLKRQAAILNKQRIKISKKLLPKQDKNGLIDEENERTDSPTDLVPNIMQKKRNTRIILGKLNKTNEDTKIKVRREQKSSVELNVVKEEAKNLNYSMTTDHDYSAEVKPKSSLKLKTVTFDKAKNTTLEISDEEENKKSGVEIKKEKLLLNDKALDDYETMLNEIENNNTSTNLGRKKSKNNSDDDDSF